MPEARVPTLSGYPGGVSVLDHHPQRRRHVQQQQEQPRQRRQGGRRHQRGRGQQAQRAPGVELAEAAPLDGGEAGCHLHTRRQTNQVVSSLNLSILV